MGCACSRSTPAAKKKKPGRAGDVFAGYQVAAPVSFDSCELPMTPSRSAGHKVLEVGSYLGKASVTGFGRAMEVLDSVGSSMSNMTSNSSFASGINMRGNKISILAFEVANTIVKGADLLMSLSNECIQLFKDEVLQSDGVTKLVSTDMKELICIAASDKREELNIFSREVIRFGDLCKDPVWHNLDRYFQKLDSNFSFEEPSKEYVETTMQLLTELARNTSELYHELHLLARFERDYQQRLHEEELLSASRSESLMILQSELQRRRKVVKGLQKKSLWSRSLEEVVEKLVEVVIFLHKEIMQALGTHFALYRPNNNHTLGVSGLALHYANVINQIDSIVCRPFSFPTNMRERLYHGLPPGVKTALSSRLRLQKTKEEYSVSHIRAEIQKILGWLVPVAENTIRAHQAFGWVGEWANIGTEVNKMPAQHSNIARIQTLYHADKAATDEHILELVVWLHHLVVQSKKKGFGSRPSKLNGSMSGKTELPDRSIGTKPSVASGLSEETLASETAHPKLAIAGRSKSWPSVVTKSAEVAVESEAHRRHSRSRSWSSVGSAPVAPRMPPTPNTQMASSNRALDVLDGLEEFRAFPFLV